MAKHRVVITGMGTVNPLGKSVPEFWRNSVQGRSGVRHIDAFPIPEGISNMAGVVSGFDVKGFELRARAASVDMATLDRSTQFALVAAEEAWRAARLPPRLGPPLEALRFGVYLSTAIGQIGSMENEFVLQSANARRRLEAGAADARGAVVWTHFQFNTTAALLAQHFGCDGGSATISTGCTGALDAIGFAMDAVRSGEVDVAITGATEAPITPLVVAAFGKIGATSLRKGDPRAASRPFDRDRDGFVLGEGCGIVIIESLEHATARGAEVLAERAGYGTLNNCIHMTDIPSDGVRIAKSAELALMDAGVTADEIDAINAHGSSTPQNDIAESGAYWRVFGARAARIPVTSIKSQIGHPLSASNGVELISAVMSLREGIIPPTINLENLDPACRLDVVGNVAREVHLKRLLKTSSGFSGIHSAVVLTR